MNVSQHQRRAENNGGQQTSAQEILFNYYSRFSPCHSRPLLPHSPLLPGKSSGYKVGRRRKWKDGLFMKQDTANGETDETGMQTLLIGLDRDYVFIQTDDDQEDSREEDGHSQMQQGETVNTTTFAQSIVGIGDREVSPEQEISPEQKTEDNCMAEVKLETEERRMVRHFTFAQGLEGVASNVNESKQLLRSLYTQTYLEKMLSKPSRYVTGRRGRQRQISSEKKRTNQTSSSSSNSTLFEQTLSNHCNIDPNYGKEEELHEKIQDSSANRKEQTSFGLNISGINLEESHPIQHVHLQHGQSEQGLFGEDSYVNDSNMREKATPFGRSLQVITDAMQWIPEFYKQFYEQMRRKLAIEEIECSHRLHRQEHRIRVLKALIWARRKGMCIQNYLLTSGTEEETVEMNQQLILCQLGRLAKSRLA